MAKMRDIVVDCSHPASLARFWAAALDGYAVAPYDDDERTRLRSLGVFDTEDDPQVLVEGPSGAPSIFFQRVPEPKSVKNRVHVDLVGDAVELDRLLALGASVVERHTDLVVLADPEGNEFCLIED
ncbi:VOC family protein [Nocardiopsis sp. MG754419]|uniref:VOC family protein n=1 Tax=Nocardiopsis sp. MG754419 TaxID=2259865 RepID=UPI001BA933FE|nr:VOC family protein [Nocardiopsis sp. MG754419]MBR8743914.1 VOC family protein [Nocardiopsis sp. MG754419]